MNLTIHENIRQVIPDCRLGYAIINEVSIGATPLPLLQEFTLLQAEAAKMYNLNNPWGSYGINPVFGIHKRVEFDSSRCCPEAESVVRQVLERRTGQYVNGAVTVIHYCILKFLLPFGLYDLDKIEGNVMYRLADHGSYVNEYGKEVDTAGKPFLIDEAGTFGNPVSDSQRTAVTLTSRNLLLLVYADENIENDELTGILDYSAGKLMEHNGGRLKLKNIVHA